MKAKKTCTYVQALMALDAVADVVLAYRPETKQKPPRKRKIDPKRQVNENTEKRESSM
jgi:hypothetical protein